MCGIVCGYVCNISTIAWIPKLYKYMDKQSPLPVSPIDTITHWLTRRIFLPTLCTDFNPDFHFCLTPPPHPSNPPPDVQPLCVCVRSQDFPVSHQGDHSFHLTANLLVCNCALQSLLSFFNWQSWLLNQWFRATALLKSLKGHACMLILTCQQ